MGKKTLSIKKDTLKAIMKKINPNTIILILLGTITWSLTMIKSGLIYSFGMGFWGPNGHDGIWHISLIESLSKGSLEIPIFAGEALKNYHIGYDLLLSWIHKLTFIPTSVLYFQIVPPLLALSLGLVVYKFVYDWKRSGKSAFWSAFFVYFGGSFSWIITLIQDGGIGGESMFWAQQSISTLINPPLTLSLVIMFSALIFLRRGLIGKKKRNLIIATFLFGVLVQIKVYAGVLSLVGLFLGSLYNLITRKGTDLFKVFSGSLIITILLFSPFSKEAQGVLIYKPFWYLETMMSFSDRLNWSKFGEAMVNYKLGRVYLKGFVAYTSAFIIFMIGNMGTRILKFFYITKKVKEKRLGYINIFIFSVIIFGVVFPMLYIQAGTAWNTIQFFYYSLVFSGVLAGIAFTDIIKAKRFSNNSNLQFITVIILFIITIPTTIGTLKHYLPMRPPAKVSKEELEALRFLAGQPEGVVLTQIFDKDKANEAIENPPRPLYLYESTAYVSAFSKKTVYLEDEVNLNITGYDWKKRREKVLSIYETSDIDDVKHFIDSSGIRYLYLVKDLPYPKFINDLDFQNVFENKEVVIFSTS